MISLTQVLLDRHTWDALPLKSEASRFSPSDIRQSIADLVMNDQLNMADALSAAGLSIYPESEDILAISALLAELRQEWQLAGELLAQLIELQAERTPAMTWVHYIRVLRCQCNPAQALVSAEAALSLHPDNAQIQTEAHELRTQFGAATLLNESTSSH